MGIEQGKGEREQLASRLGFILLSAGCAIGLGNVWRFPYVCGQYGGAIFLLFYFAFLVLLGYPVMVMELSVGRAGRRNLAGCYARLAPEESRRGWSALGKLFFTGNVFLLMFYPVITGWLLSYTWDYLTGAFGGMASEQIPAYFGGFLGNWQRQLLFAYAGLAMTIGICITGLKSGVERTTKFMMLGLFVLMIALAVQALRLPNAGAGVEFFLKPDLDTLKEHGIWQAIHAAMGQAFFTLSLGIGSIAIFGSYIERKQSLSQEATIIIGLDTFVALCSGLIIFPCCFAFGVTPNAGPGLIFVTLPRIFLDMGDYGRLRGFVFFLFMSIAALTTLVAVAENIIAFGIDQLHLKRRTSTLLVGLLLMVGTLPCLFGFNLWQSFQPFGEGTCVLDLEDFIVSDNLLPLGALALTIFCGHRIGWGHQAFLEEANAGSGFHFPKFLHAYCRWVLPIIIFALWAIGIIKKFC